MCVRGVFFACFGLGFLWVCALAAQDPPAQQKPPNKKTLSPPPDKPLEEDPPEEDASLIPKEYALNPLECVRNINTGNFYFKKGNVRAAAKRYLEATKWDPGSPEAFFKLGEADERLKDRAGAREAYTKYLELSPDAKNAAELKKKMEKW